MRALWGLGAALAAMVACNGKATDGASSSSGGTDAGGSGPTADASVIETGSSSDAGPGVGAETTLSPAMYNATTKIALVGDRVVFELLDYGKAGPDPQLYAVPMAGGTAVLVPTPDTPMVPGPRIGDFAADDTSVFSSIVTAGTYPAGIYRTDFAGGADSVPTMLTEATDARSIALTANTVVWVEGTAGDVKSCVKTTCTPQLLAAGPGAAGFIAVDDTRAFIAYDSGLLASVPLTAGGTLATLATNAVGFTSITLDATSVYVADVNGVIFTIAKTGSAMGITSFASGAGARSLTTDGTTLFWLADRGGVWSKGSSDPLFVAPDGSENSQDQAPHALAVSASGFFYGGDGVFFRAR